ncbi:helix-turn-helix domain-containing protein [Novosphingobium sp. UBA1939]|uniref:helix-turn-helix domain-containing protein n=1 Tax=Novosphingobium sp. UBA1939 TaxID=1946982 RepID=UPI0025F518E2|nr:helix-turn-helix transcriptional regulator [Novosphingobium sp. UBA1939]
MAGLKIRQWRKAQRPRISGETFAEMFGISMTQLYRIENGYLPNGTVMRDITARGICTAEDWFEKVEAAA